MIVIWGVLSGLGAWLGVVFVATVAAGVLLEMSESDRRRKAWAPVVILVGVAGAVVVGCVVGWAVAT